MRWRWRRHKEKTTIELVEKRSAQRELEVNRAEQRRGGWCTAQRGPEAEQADQARWLGPRAQQLAPRARWMASRAHRLAPGAQRLAPRMMVEQTTQV